MRNQIFLGTLDLRLFVFGLLIVTQLNPVEAGDQISKKGGRVSSAALATMSCGILIGTSLALDRRVREWGHEQESKPSSERYRKIGDVGNISGLLGGIFFGIGAQLTQSQTAEITSMASYQVFLVTGGLSVAAKKIVGRERPFQNDPWRMDKGNSFPSGHTMEAFGFATVLSKQYPSPAVSIPAYAGASFVGFSRVYNNKHWLSDVAVGAVLGVLVGNFVTRNAVRSATHDTQFVFTGEGVQVSQKFGPGDNSK